jgi:hypothetical protein
MSRRQLVGRSVLAGGVGALVLAAGGIGVATAVNGGSLVLGGSNTATHNTTLSDVKGTPLSLFTKKSTPPLKVNSKAMVRNLNAGELGGLSAGKLSVGSSAQLKINLLSTTPKVIALPQPIGTSPNLTVFPTSIVSTAKLAAGTYEVNGTALAAEVLCWLGTTPAVGSQQYSVATEGGGTVAEAASFKVKKGQRVHEFCAGLDQTSGDPGGTVLSAGIDAVRVVSSSKGLTKKATSTVAIARTAKLLK